MTRASYPSSCPATHAARLAAVCANILMHKLMLFCFSEEDDASSWAMPFAANFRSRIKQYLGSYVTNIDLFSFVYLSLSNCSMFALLPRGHEQAKKTPESSNSGHSLVMATDLVIAVTFYPFLGNFVGRVMVVKWTKIFFTILLAESR